MALSDTDIPVAEGRRLRLVLSSTNQTEVLSDNAPPATNTIDLSKSRLRLLVVPD